MDPLLLTIVLRAVERLFIVAAGAGAIYLGYRLFLAMPDRDRSSGKLELPGGVSIFLSRVGPGVFFSLFGAAVIAMALQFGVSFSDKLNVPETALAAVRAADAGSTAASRRKTSYSGMVEPSAERDRAGSEVERTGTEVTIRNLNRAVPALRDGLAPADRLDVEQGVQDAKLRLMRAVWSEAKWGPYARFLAWVEAGEPDPAPAEVRGAVVVYRAGLATGGSSGR